MSLPIIGVAGDGDPCPFDAHSQRLILPREFQDIEVEVNTWRAIASYLWLGLSPGSYATALLLGDYDQAIVRAHPSIRSWITQVDVDVTANMIDVIGVFPEVCWGHSDRINQWLQRGGLRGQPRLMCLFRLTF